MTIPNAERVQVIKIERLAEGGGEDDTFNVGIDSKEDALEARGYYFQPAGGPKDEDVWTARDGDNLKFRDKQNTTPVTLSQMVSGGGITEAQHAHLDTLVHALCEDSYTEIIRTGNKVTSVITWAEAGKLKKIREAVIQRVTGKLSQIDVIQYDADGIEKQRLTGVIARSSGKVSSITWTETVS